jgi:L-asparagine oxygenase
MHLPHILKIRLSNPAKRRLLEALLERPYPLSEDYEDYIRWASDAFRRAAPANLLQLLAQMRDDPEPPGVLCIRNGPTDPNLPSTPLDGLPSLDKETSVSEGFLVGLVRQLDPGLLSFRAEKPSLVNDIVGVRGYERQLTNRGSQVYLGFHTEQAYLQSRRARWLALYGLRDDEAGMAVTPVADIRDAQVHLSAAERACLRESRFRFRAPILHGRDDLSEPAPVLSGPPRCPEVCVALYGDLTVAVDEEAKAALIALEAAFGSVAHPVRVVPGTFVAVSNRLAVHARSPFEGSQRWLQRVIAADRWSWRGEIGQQGRIVTVN